MMPASKPGMAKDLATWESKSAKSCLNCVAQKWAVSWLCGCLARLANHVDHKPKDWKHFQCLCHTLRCIWPRTTAWASLLTTCNSRIAHATYTCRVSNDDIANATYSINTRATEDNLSRATLHRAHRIMLHRHRSAYTYTAMVNITLQRASAVRRRGQNVRTVSMMICGTGGLDGMNAELLSTALKWSKIWVRSVTLSAARPHSLCKHLRMRTPHESSAGWPVGKCVRV